MQYFTKETQLPSYIPYPHFLLTMPLNETARLVYSLILSRIHLSQANNWVDNEGRVYCRYTIQDLMAHTDKSKSTIVTALHDLESHGLLFRRRGGAGYANMLYLRLPENCTSDVQKPKPQRSGKPVPNNRNENNYDYTGDGL